MLSQLLGGPQGPCGAQLGQADLEHETSFRHCTIRIVSEFVLLWPTLTTMSFKKASTLHLEVVNETIEKIGASDYDVVLHSDDGEKVFTSKKFLGIFSPLIRQLCSEFGRSEIVPISLPFSNKVLCHFLDYLKKGETFGRKKNDLESVLQVTEILGIARGHAEILNPEPETIDYEEIEIEIEDEVMEEVEEDVKPEIDIDIDHPDEENNFKCNKCSKFYSTLNKLTNHKKLEHTQIKEFNCDVCSKKFATEAILNNHMAVHNSKVASYMARASH